MDKDVPHWGYSFFAEGERAVKEAAQRHSEIDKTNVKRQKHYEQYEIQPVDYIVATLGPGWLVGNVIKYVMRYNEKNGRQDILKAMHYLEMLLNHVDGRGPRDYGTETKT